MGDDVKLGRPLKLVDDDKTLATLGGLAKIQCTTKEAAAVLGVSEPTFFAFLKRFEKAAEVWENGKESGKASLKRTQFKMSETNATMAIWLGKQYLGQTDKQDGVGAGGVTINIVKIAEEPGKVIDLEPEVQVKRLNA